MNYRVLVPTALLLGLLGTYLYQTSVPDTVAFAQSCSSAVTPPLVPDKWYTPGTKTVWIDPALPAADRQNLIAGINSFAVSMGENMALSSSPVQPTTSYGLYIIITAVPSGSTQSSFEYTQDNNQYVNGQRTNNEVSATATLNYHALIPGSTSKMYDANQTNAAAYIQAIGRHIMGHAYGLSDTPVPNNNYNDQVRGGSIMNGSLGTNDEGHNLPTSVQSCDLGQLKTKNPTGTGGLGTPGLSSGSGGGSGGPTTPGSGGGSGGGATCTEEWDDDTNTLTYYCG